MGNFLYKMSLTKAEQTIINGECVMIYDIDDFRLSTGENEHKKRESENERISSKNKCKQY